jgi:hypothetical protein
MATTLANRAWRSSAAENLDDDLATLWRELAREAPVSRAVMSNLVVFCRAAAADDVDLASPPEGVPIDDVARDHPARVILLYHDPDAPEENATRETPLAAAVGVLTFGPLDARYGVEQIVLRTACSEAALPSIVRRLMLGDVPTSVWWTDDLSRTHPVAPLVTMGRQLLYDSRRWRDVPAGVRALAPLLADRFGPDLADVNWRRLLPVRQALVHAVGSSDTAKRQRLTSVRIHHRHGEAALAWLFAGWLQHVCGPPDGGRVLLDAPESIRPSASARATRDGETSPKPDDGGKPDSTRPDPAAYDITVDEDSDLDEDVLTASFADGLHVPLGSHRLSIDDPHGPAPFAIAVPSETEAEAVAAELRVLTHDTALRNTLAVLVQRFRDG